MSLFLCFLFVYLFIQLFIYLFTYLFIYSHNEAVSNTECVRVYIYIYIYVYRRMTVWSGNEEIEGM
jgi:hypothetical protein